MAASTRADVRWRERRVTAAAVDAVAIAMPVIAALAFVVLFSRTLPAPNGPGPTVLWWTAVGAVAAAVIVLFERQARRLLPLSSLLRLGMAFPDQAPSRLSVALRAGTVRDLERRLHQLRHQGLAPVDAGTEPAAAAETILTLASALNAHDRRTRGHSERVRAYTDLLAAEMGLSDDERDRLRWASLLHDIGKLEVGTKILNKDGPLDRDEWSVMHQHPEIGARVTAPLREWLGEWVHAVDQHHENFDGTGYPFGLRGDQIALGARIVAVSDAFEVMTALRSYKRPMNAAAARRELAYCSGAQFDPVVVRAFLNLSLGRIAWMVGPIAWLTSLRLVGPASRLKPVFSLTARNAVFIGGSVAVAAVLITPGTAGYQAEADPTPTETSRFAPFGSTLATMPQPEPFNVPVVLSPVAAGPPPAEPAAPAVAVPQPGRRPAAPPPRAAK
ncbi:MAG: HD-GYP domain-containing protein, partial [Catenulispora sp.]